MHVVVASVPGRESWLRDCLASIGRDVVVVSHRGHELDKIRWVYENTTFDRFLFLQDSVVVKDQAFFDLCDGEGSVSIADHPGPFGMYLGVYTRETLETVDLPHVHDREHAITLERDWCRRYADAGPWRLLFDDLRDENASRTEVRHGRINLRIENDYLIKFKGTWR